MNWQPLYPTATYLFLAVAIIGLLVIARRIAVSSKTRRWPLFVLRGALLAGLAVLLLNPIDRRETTLPPRPPSVALLVDCSQSMALGVGRSRLDGVKKTINSVTRWIKTERPMRLPLFRFGKHLAKVPSVAELEANEDASLLAEALERLPSRIASDQPRAVVLFSDGAVPETEHLTKIAAAYRKLEVPVHTIVSDVGNLRGDIAITKLAVPQRVTTGDQATVSAVIESRGYDRQRVVVSVRPADRPNAAPLASLPITLSDGPTQCELIITADPSLGDLAIEVPVLEGEAVASNNRIPFRLAERDRALNVLYMEGTAGLEYHWLRDALQEDSDIRCVPMTVNNQYAARPSLQRVDDRYRGFPATREELFKFDVVICSDIPRGAFTPEQIDWTVELVDKRGGGFVMIGGHTSFGAGNWDSTVWDQLIPFDMTNRRDYLQGGGIGVSIPKEALSHPIWKLLEDPEQNRAALEAMPYFTGTNLISRVKPAATLLGQTKTPLSRVGIMPVFACETFGRGRTFAMSTDTTSSWGRYFESQWGEGDNRYYRKFWRNVIRWLAENSRASQRRLIVHTDQVIYSPGEPIQIVAEAFDGEYRSTTDYRVTARLLSDESTAADDQDLADGLASGLEANPALQRYTAAIPALLSATKVDLSEPMQTATLIVTAYEGDKEIASESIQLQLLHDSAEWLRPQTHPETLRLVAESGGGTMLSSENDLRQLLRSFDTTPGEVLVHKLPLWDHWLIWAILLSLLAIEWTLRRRGRSQPATIA